MDSHKKYHNTSSDDVVKKCNKRSRKKHCRRHCHLRKRQVCEHKSTQYSCRGRWCNKNLSQNNERINFKCILNLNTNVCGHNNHNQYQRKRESKEKYSSNAREAKAYGGDRIVPCCFRSNCRVSRYPSREIRTRRCERHHFNSKRKHEDTKRRPNHMVYKSRHLVQLRKNHRSRTPTRLSPISSSLLVDESTHTSHEDISNISLGDSFTMPISYRNISRESPTCSYSKLDTLIKRTKERERKMREISKNITSTSTPLHSDDETSSISIHSLPTLILGPQTDISSPEVQDTDPYCPIKEELRPDNTTYSPTINIESSIPKLNDHTTIKVEPRLDSSEVSLLYDPVYLKIES